MFERNYINRRRLISATGAITIGLFSSKSFSGGVSYTETFSKVFEEIRDNYCYFPKKIIDWKILEKIYFERSNSLKSQDELKHLVAEFLRETYDPHTHLQNSIDGIPRWPVLDIYTIYKDKKIIVRAVQPNSAAELSGIKKGDEIIEIDGIDADAVLGRFLPKSVSRHNSKMLEFAANQAVTGLRGHDRKFKIHRKSKTFVIHVPMMDIESQPDFEYATLNQGIGYVAIRTFANEEIIPQFEKAMIELNNSKSLIIDVRGNGGGDTSIARPIMGHFVKEKTAYAQMCGRDVDNYTTKWIEYIEPNGEFFDGPVAILCDYWSASMAEGFPMGMRAICGAKIIGTKMMGLGAAVKSVEIDEIKFQYSFEPVFDIYGKPRDEFKPDVFVDIDQDIIGAAKKMLKI